MRAAMTYRSERRNNWRALKGVTWAEHNLRSASDPWHIGSMQSRRVTWRRRPRSKYMPHIGAKQRAKGAARTTTDHQPEGE